MKAEDARKITNLNNLMFTAREYLDSLILEAATRGRGRITHTFRLWDKSDIDELAKVLQHDGYSVRALPFDKGGYDDGWTLEVSW